MKATAPLIVRLVGYTNGLRNRAIAEGAASADQIDSILEADARPPLRTLITGYYALRSVLTIPGGWGTLDDRSQLLLKALDDEPEPIAGTKYLAFTKSYRALQIADDLGMKAVRFANTATVEEQRAIFQFVDRLLVWGICSEEQSWPIQGRDIPEWVSEIPFTDAHTAFDLANRQRCEAILEDHMRLVDPAAVEYIPREFQFLSEQTALTAETLMSSYSYAFCLALAEVARDLRGATANAG